MKYRHSFHAGNFADTVKHLTLLAILKALERKPAPYFCLDTHAGRGRYVLRASAEFAAGFARLRSAQDRPALLDEYVTLVEGLCHAPPPVDGTDCYAGSPLIAAAMLRPQDRLAAFELVSAEAERLRAALAPYPNAAAHCGDGYEALRSQLPPRERRGLVLIDPPYELQEREFPKILDALTVGYGRWPTGIYALWYPIKQRAGLQRFHQQLQETGIRKILCAQLLLFPDDSRVSLNGCGMIVVNPPWQLQAELNVALVALHALLGGQSGTGAQCFWLVGE